MRSVLLCSAILALVQGERLGELCSGLARAHFGRVIHVFDALDTLLQHFVSLGGVIELLL